MEKRDEERSHSLNRTIYCVCFRLSVSLYLPPLPPSFPPPPPPTQDGKRQSAYQAKMHLATLARKVKAADAIVGCPGHERVCALLHTVEGVLAALKSKEAAPT